MRTKNILALKTLVRVGETFGDSLGDTCWVHVLKCCSRYEHLHALAGGFDDSCVFLNDKNEIGSTSTVEGSSNTPTRLFSRDSSAEIILSSTATPLTAHATDSGVSKNDDDKNATAVAVAAEQFARKASMHDAKISLVPLNPSLLRRNTCSNSYIQIVSTLYSTIRSDYRVKLLWISCVLCAE